MPMSRRMDKMWYIKHAIFIWWIFMQELRWMNWRWIYQAEKSQTENLSPTNTEWQTASAAKSLRSCPTLCDLIDGSPPGSSVPGILQARILEWVAISFFNACMHAKSLQLCPTLCYLIDGSPPGSSVPGILQARIQEWVAISFSKHS